ncbi:monooxygenase family protein [Virgibacillus senegalensis]|uniref:monooxygenase family protein n=1 Tax=Virgibacillus senegalensis TaxID=1499679 RepID=UPI000DA632B0|nr:DUF4188 domain-containing protein [Virgibacillus senegalensis]
MQYLRTEQELLTYTKDTTTWRKFNKRVQSNKSVGIYHETYNAISNRIEVFYINMPRFELGKAFTHSPVVSSTNTVINE